MRKLIAAVAATVAIFAATEVFALPSVGQTAPDFNFTALRGTTHTKLSDYAAANEIVMIKFWATT